MTHEPNTVLINRTAASVLRRLPPEAFEYMKESLQDEPVWFDIDWVAGLDLPMPDEADRPSSLAMLGSNSTSSNCLDTTTPPRRRGGEDDAFPPPLQRLQMPSPSAVSPPASGPAIQLRVGDDDSGNSGEETDFDHVPASIHRSRFRMSSSSSGGGGTSSTLERLLAGIAEHSVSSVTVQRCVAAQRFFIDYYYHHFLYLARRRERLGHLRSYCDRHRFPSSIRDGLFESFRRRETNMLRQKRRQIKVSQFQILWQIGRGHYGQVFLATKKDTHEVCAIKRLKKSFLLSSDRTDSVMTERDILSAADSEWLVKLLYSFQDTEYLYLAMEYVPGGDLRSLLHDFGILPEEHAAFYMAEMTTAVSVLHSIGYFHRDIKPENWLVDATGHLKLTDFGLSKSGMIRKFVQQWSAKTAGFRPVQRNRSLAELKDCHWKRQRDLQRERSRRTRDKTGRAFSRVGSPDYMAPELLADQGYDYMVDYWALGCILYEMLAGVGPFSGYTAAEVFRNILEFETTLTRPLFEDEENETISDNAWDLITKLLTHPDVRLGRVPGGLVALKAHPLFSALDWDKLRNMADLPFKPNLNHSLDTKYFDPIAPEDLPAPSPDEIEKLAAHIQKLTLSDGPAPTSCEKGEKGEKGADEEKTPKIPRTPRTPSNLRVNTVNGAMLKGFTFEHHGPREQLLMQLTEAELMSPSIRTIVESFLAANEDARRQQDAPPPPLSTDPAHSSKEPSV